MTGGQDVARALAGHPRCRFVPAWGAGPECGRWIETAFSARLGHQLRPMVFVRCSEQHTSLELASRLPAELLDTIPDDGYMDGLTRAKLAA